MKFFIINSILSLVTFFLIFSNDNLYAKSNDLIKDKASSMRSLSPNNTKHDTRIKTFLYSESDIYKVLVYNGFQTSVEFARGEVIETISLGDSYAWKITPVDRRLFIKPLEENIHTNMTIITNYRTYQFELFSKAPDDYVDNNFAYVVRFFYPNG